MSSFYLLGNAGLGCELDREFRALILQRRRACGQCIVSGLLAVRGGFRARYKLLLLSTASQLSRERVISVENVFPHICFYHE